MKTREGRKEGGGGWKKDVGGRTEQQYEMAGRKEEPERMRKAKQKKE